MIRPKLPPYQKKKTASQIMSINTTTIDLPIGTIPLEHQVAGHTFQTGTNAIGMLKDQNDGSVMKPTQKIICGSREIKFYEELQTTPDPYLALIKDHIPEYRGTVKLNIGGRNVVFLRLADVTHDMSEPCILDIKIGKRTWDPLATEEKINAEEQKYQDCKKNLGLCLPGFQVYNLATGRINRYGKDYGKKLNKTTIKDALKIFLNGEGGFCRSLLMQILSGLWSIQKWARTQKSLRLYSSSLLLAYDCRRLRNSVQLSKKNSNGVGVPHTLKNTHTTPENGQISAPKWPQPTSETIQVYKKLQRCHSTKNNYEEDIKAIQENYGFMLDNLMDAHKDSEVWAFVKMIDFAHVFPAEEESVDSNYLFGIESLVKIFEQFLKECD